MCVTATSDADRFLALLKPIERDLERYARRLMWEPHEAPDALQNAVLRAFAAFHRYHEDASFRTWMFKILTREAFALNRNMPGSPATEFNLNQRSWRGWCWRWLGCRELVPDCKVANRLPLGSWPP